MLKNYGRNLPSPTYDPPSLPPLFPNTNIASPGNLSVLLLLFLLLLLPPRLEIPAMPSRLIVVVFRFFSLFRLIMILPLHPSPPPPFSREIGDFLFWGKEEVAFLPN